MKKPTAKNSKPLASGDYGGLVGNIGELLEIARRTSARAVNALMTATYWEIGRRIVEFEQGGEKRAEYGKEMLRQLAHDLSAIHGKGFSRQNLQNMRVFYLSFLPLKICQTASGKSGAPTAKPVTSKIKPQKIESLSLDHLQVAFPLPWSHYILLTSHSRSPQALDFYQTEALRGGWTVRQLRRQMDSQFYERTALSRNKEAMLKKGAKAEQGDVMTAAEEIRDPLVLEFLGLKDEYSETDLEEALILHLEHFLLELGNDFAFIGRQRRMRIDNEWFRVDLLFFHRRLRCLVIIELKLGKFTHADAGQMHLYLNYAAANWTQPGENPPVGMILCSGKGASLVHYSTDNLPNKILVRDYLTALPDEGTLAEEIASARRRLEARKP
jgi:predicted nuclease of restriction endonuclease-like (RecB) superfamily